MYLALAAKASGTIRCTKSEGAGAVMRDAAGIGGVVMLCAGVWEALARGGDDCGGAVLVGFALFAPAAKRGGKVG